ncbi:MAG: hypothetical protein AAF429_04905 [Pseudomonadota bacterium]
MTVRPFTETGKFRPFSNCGITYQTPWRRPTREDLWLLRPRLQEFCDALEVSAWLCGSFLDPEQEAWDIDIALACAKPRKKGDIAKLFRAGLDIQANMIAEANVLIHFLYFNPFVATKEQVTLADFWLFEDDAVQGPKFSSVVFSMRPLNADSRQLSDMVFETLTVVPSAKHLKRRQTGHREIVPEQFCTPGI